MTESESQASPRPQHLSPPLTTAIYRWLASLACALVLLAALLDFGRIAWGTGVWVGQFSLKWGLAFAVFSVFCGLALLGSLALIWDSGRLDPLTGALTRARQKMGGLRFPLALLAALVPAWFLLYTPWGEVFTSPALRLLLLLATAAAGGYLLTQERARPVSWLAAAAGFVLTGSIFVLAESLTIVRSYPFSLDWSEGNRMWDYSILYGRRLYDFQAGEEIFAFIDRGRQSLWGLPFLLPYVSITGSRLWSAFLFSVPYAILGWVAFWPRKGHRWQWAFLGLWTLLFLNQGPIYTPLVLSAILVAGARRAPVWVGVLLVLLAGFYAQLARFTWMFAPALWAGMLVVGSASLEGPRLKRATWAKATALTLAALVGGVLIPRLSPGAPGEATAELASASGILAFISRQPLLWYRLLPNATYDLGIILGLALATGPLLALLLYLAFTRRWKLSLIQKLSIALPLLAFLAVGLVVSVKIGGGGNLHNLDMFLIGLVYTAVLAWEAGGDQLLARLDQQPPGLKTAVLLCAAIPAFFPMLDGEPLLLPPAGQAAAALETIQTEVARAKSKGEVLFMDQRQLLTFGYIVDVPLVDDYEKKYLMDQALSGDEQYFEGFYQDLAARRFSLIISHPIKIQQQGRTHNFGEENDAWDFWVGRAMLCYYEPLVTLKEVGIELFVPRQTPGGNCP